MGLRPRARFARARSSAIKLEKQKLYWFALERHRLTSKNITIFYEECLDAWSQLNKQNILSYEDVANQVIWNNKHIKIKKESVFEKHLLEEGFLTVGDLFFRKVNRDLSPIDRFKLMGLIGGRGTWWMKTC